MATPTWYRSDIGHSLKPITRHVYTHWSGIPDDELIDHLHRIRDKAWPLAKYPCIGLWIFLLPGLASLPEFPSVVEKARSQPDPLIIDVGCGLGQNLRLLADHSVPTTNMWGVDLEPRLWELGFDLFRDAHRMRGRFIGGDFLTMPDDKLGRLAGKADVIIAQQFLHLFDWDGQLTALKRMVDMSKPGTILVGHQRGAKTEQEIKRPWGKAFLHDSHSFTRMWEIIQKETTTQWTLDVKTVDILDWGLEEADLPGLTDGDRTGLTFVITRHV
ncbi:hypothetical protein ASPWEDRAFT_32402 [Aspergillus wentii DTO 134E9]|uniref:Methyltransferase domain-containing protein n=1 Tax=Aspergillus wentii DTO 134E9 TaxID=1073089 RepID=A0A1L9R5L7_ASPWE|nr:uncharacterized protein ASPWEDRAFT_32402 [Aspergillus wentii DTO 134E9]KAI9925302.1 hypothetical protein MW887_006229 [Aspergillus wentii]OJJ30200.1 hypothetical protein ASPWEDRAFT_32402 [Aspergillus wentii DTO 134E9]